MVLQTPRPFAEMTVRENVVLGALFGSTDGRPDEATAFERADEALGFVRLADRGDDDVGTLNLHEQRFLDLARALAGRPRAAPPRRGDGRLERHRTAGVDRDRAHSSRLARRHGDLGRARDEGGAQPRRTDRRAELRPAAGGRRAARRDARTSGGDGVPRRTEGGRRPRCWRSLTFPPGTSARTSSTAHRSPPREGEVVAVIGSNGAGKTTLFRAICGLLRPSRGEVRFDGDVDHRSAGAPHRPSRARLRTGRARSVPPDDRRRASRPRRLPAASRRGSAGARVRPVPPSGGAAATTGGDDERRGTADARRRPGTDEEAEVAAARRADHGAGADPGGAGLRRPRRPPRARPDDRRRRATGPPRLEHRRSRLRARERDGSR